MEIHKVKPIHSWRDFLKELGTIVLGIIIAISLERLVESWRWASDVSEARQALVAEIVANNTNLLAWRVAAAPCVDREISKVNNILAALERKDVPASLVALHEPVGSLTRDSEWQSERASEVLTHFPRTELALMSRYYAQMGNFGEWLTTERNAWFELKALQSPLTEVTASDLLRLHARLNAARGMENLIVLNAKRELSISRQLGIADPAPEPERLRIFCTMSPEDYQRYRSSRDLR